MKCKTVNKKLTAYFNRELSNTENVEIEKHLNICNSCAAIYENLKNTYELSDKIPRLEPNPFLYTRIKSKLEEYEKQKNKYRTYPGILQPVFISLMLIIAVLSGIKLGSLDKINSDKSLYVSHTTEYYFNDLAQENAEVLLLND